MQRKHIFVLIFLAFGIAMELVLALHFLIGPSDRPMSSQIANGKIVNTIALKTGQVRRGAQPGAGSASGDAASGFGESSLPGQDGSATGQEILPGQEGLPGQELTPAYPMDPAQEGQPEELITITMDPAVGGPEGGGAIPPDEDHPPGSEPDDSDPNWRPTQPPFAVTDTPQPPATATRTAPTATRSQPTATRKAAQPDPTATRRAALPTATNPARSPAPTQTRKAPTASPEAPNGLVSAPAAGGAPAIDGSGGDAAWAKARAMTVKTGGGANHSATQVTLRSIYDNENVYFLLTWADPTQNLLRQPWEKQKDGSWKKLTGANNTGGDENQYFMDKIALLWPINNSLPDFNKTGCGGACHSGANAGDKPTGVMYTGGPGQRGDLWMWKPAQTIGQVDDGYLDDTRYSKDSPWAGISNDPSDGGGYRANQSKDKKSPAFMPKGGGDKTGIPGYILEASKEVFNPRLFKAGDRVPSILAAPYQGDRADIRAAWKYKNGVWTLELARKRVTGSQYDVQFGDLNTTYAFALATFDNTQVRHAVQNGALTFKFQQ